MQFIDLKSGCYFIGSGKWYGDFVFFSAKKKRTPNKYAQSSDEPNNMQESYKVPLTLRLIMERQRWILFFFHFIACAVIKFWSRFKLFTNIYSIVAESTE